VSDGVVVDVAVAVVVVDDDDVAVVVAVDVGVGFVVGTVVDVCRVVADEDI